MDWTRFTEVAGLLLGLIYLYLEYRADWRMWFVSVVMPINSLFVYWQAGLYADFGIDIYYVLIAVYGFWAWRRGGGAQREELPIRRTPARMWPLLVLAFAVIYLALALVLIHLTDSTVPWWDALNTALSIVAMWMLARKWVEQWLVWLVVDAVSTALYVYKGIPFYAVLYAIYTVIAWFGYRKWLRRMEEEQTAQKECENVNISA